MKLVRGGAGTRRAACCLAQAAEPLDAAADDEPDDDEADAVEVDDDADDDEPESEPDDELDFAESDDFVDGEAGVLLDDDPRLSFR